MAEGRILVVGAGTMGRGIAGVCALAGYDTRVFDADPSAQRAVRPAIESSWSRAIDRGRLSTEAADAARHRLRIAERLRDAADVDFAIEAVPEALDLKRMVFSELDDLCPDRTVFGSNTSSLPITRIAHATGRRDRVIGIHFFNPVAAMPLVEVVRGKDTSASTEARTLELVRSLGKEAVRVFDSPGFATSRLGVALGLEAMRMVEEGVAGAADIDRAMELGYGHRMGPLKTSDFVGLDVRLAIAETLAAELAVGPLSAPRHPEDAGCRGADGQEGRRGVLPLGGGQGGRRGHARRRPPEETMNVNDRRGLNLGVVLVALGVYFILRRSLHLHGPGPILLLIGTILFALSALRRFRGPLVPASVMLGLGAAFLMRDPLEPWMPGWATLLLGIGAGLLLASGLDRLLGRERRPAPFVPGLVLVAIALVTAASANLSIPESFSDVAWRLWPFVLVAAGAVLVLQALRSGSSNSSRYCSGRHLAGTYGRTSAST